MALPLYMVKFKVANRADEVTDLTYYAYAINPDEAAQKTRAYVPPRYTVRSHKAGVATKAVDLSPLAKRFKVSA